MKRLIILLLICMRMPVLSSASTLGGAALDTVIVNLDSTWHASCFGESDGVAFVSITSGTAPFSFLWSNGDTLQNADSLSAGYYGLTVTDADGSQAILDSIEIGQPLPLELSLAFLENPTCNGQFGTLSIVATGGTAPYQFLWNTGDTESTLDSLAAGNYSVTAKDANGCTDTLEISLQSIYPTAELTADGNITCTRNSVSLDGSASSQGSDVVFTWTATNGGRFTSDLDSLVVTTDAAGTYFLEITDTLTGCSAMDSVLVELDTLAPIADAGTGGTLNCYAPSFTLDGSASSQGDVFSYHWTTLDGNIAAGADSLYSVVDAPGTYTLTVTNTLNGCTDDDGDVVVDADFTAPTGLMVLGGTITCFEPTLRLQSFFDPTNAIFDWSSDNGFASTEYYPVVDAGGDYILTVTDTLNGCSSTATATVIAYLTAPDLSLTGGIITCANPTAAIQTTTQTADVVFYWAGPNNFSSTDQNPVVELPGLYEVVGQDTVYGCIALDSVLVGIDTVAPIADAGNGFALNCNTTQGNLDGTASSQGDFGYLWTTLDGHIAEGSQTLSPLVDSAGTYTLTVTNPANGCVATDEVVVVQRQPITVQILDLQNVSCHGSATGLAAVTGVGGSGEYSYVWSNGSLSGSADGLVAGSYTVVVTDNEACSAAYTLIVGQPDLLVANTTATGQSLAGINDGTASVSPTGGTAPYSFEWSNGATMQGIANLAPGAYTVTVMDDKGCTAMATANVNEFPCNLTGSVTPHPANCFGAADGSALIILSNATQPVHYTWSNGDTLAMAGSLVAGIYTVSVSDSTNCSLEFVIEITQPTAISISEIFHEDAPCPTDATGSVTVAVNGGVQPYQFNWSSGSTEATANGLSIGEHSLTLTDGNGCGQVLTTTILGTDATPPTVVTQDLTVNLGSDGTVSILPEDLDAGSFDACGIATWAVSPNVFDCSNLGEQVVTLTATDANGNSNSALATVTVEDKTAPVLTCPSNVTRSTCDPALSFLLPVVEDNCDVDIAQLQQTAGLPTGSDFPSGETVQAFNYTDAAGNVGECSFTVTVVNSLEVGLVVSDASCFTTCDGTATLTPEFGIAPYQINWSNGEASSSLNGLCAGFYEASVTDASGCEQLVSVQISEPTVIELALENVANPLCPDAATGQISVSATGGTLPYSFDWSNGSNVSALTGLAVGTYTLTLTDANGCTASLSQTLASNDTESPVLSLQNITVSLGANGTASISAAQFDAGSTDNCGIVNWTLSNSSFDCGSIGDQVVTLTATDASGNASTGTATVTVVDNIVPTLVCPANISVGFCAPSVQFLLPEVDDNCTVDPALLLQTAGLASGAVFPTGTTTQAFSYTDAAGNVGTCSFTVTVSAAANLTATVENAICNDECDGTVSLTIAGGLSPFSILWNDGQTGMTASGLCAGDITASVTDASGCQQIFTATVSEPAALGFAVNSTNDDIAGAGIGSISITVSGGILPYTFAWTKDGQAFANTEDLVNLNTGNYAVLVTDANGCTIASNDIFVDNLTGTSEPAWAAELHLFPNPATDRTQLSVGQVMPQDTEVRILDQQGRVVLASSMKKGTASRFLDLLALPSGTYTVQLRTASEMVARPLVIQK